MSNLTALEHVDPWPCHRKPRAEWCDKKGRADFMGHTCVPIPAAPLFLPWFADQFECGVPEPSAVSQSIAYLEGLKAGDPERFVYLSMALSQFRSLEVMLRQLKQNEVRMPR